MKKRIGSLFLLTLTVAAQEPGPVFHVGTKLVQVDVVVRDKKGPIEGLTKDNFTVLDNGKPQTISVFSVRSSVKPAQNAPRPAMVAPLGMASNLVDREGEAPGTDTVLLIDQRNTPQSNQIFAIQRIVKFLETRHKRDRIGIYTFTRDGSLEAVQDLTDNADLLIRAAKSVKAQDPSYRNPDTTGMSDHAAEGHDLIELMAQVSTTKGVLESIARHLAHVPGRKNLIWITTGFPLTPYGAVDFRPDMEAVARTLNHANVALYAVDVRGLIGALSGLTGMSNADTQGADARGAVLPGQFPPPERGAPRGNRLRGADSEVMLANLTGGLAFINKSNGIEESIQTAVDDGELTYTLGFYPVQEPAAGVHKLKVDVDRRGVSVRYRENYTADTAAAPVARPTLEELLKDSLDATQIGLSAGVTPDPAKPGAYVARVLVDLHDVKLEQQEKAWVGELAVSFLVEGSKGYRVLGHKINIPENQLAASLEKGITIETPLEAAGSAGVLRIVVQDQASGTAGSLRVPLGSK
jgi:VWFA-related protein